MGIEDGNGEFNDVLEDIILQAVVTIGTTETELAVSGSPDPDREVVRVYNSSNQTIFVGPAGVTASTGEPLRRRQSMEMPIGTQSLFAVTASGTADVIVWELG